MSSINSKELNPDGSAGVVPTAFADAFPRAFGAGGGVDMVDAADCPNTSKLKATKVASKT
ncbi:hypothetical protein EXS57_01955 [Candidatus Kaiserbacteria bacterium]|nr:hypothetical protein [Candidatus Kaiserbacteria bacterium]